MVVISALLMLLGACSAAEISLIYPRVLPGQDSFRYEQKVDSSFIFGQVSGASALAELGCNGKIIARHPDGAFLAFLKLPSDDETQCWNLSLIERGDTLAKREFCFGRMPLSPDLSWTQLDPPIRLTVTSATAHTRTQVAGSYHLFPVKGASLRAIAEAQGWYKIEVAPGLVEVIEASFVEKSVLPINGRCSLGNAEITHNDATTRISFSCTKLPLWSEQISSDEKSLGIVLYEGVAAIDRIRYHGKSRSKICDILWAQQSDGIKLEVCAYSPINFGYRILATDSTFEIVIRDAPREGLHGKFIVLDPGHGGAAEGAIGPRGTKEKDINLAWARSLARELEAQGATVALTRERDMEMSLPERVRFARKVGADVMLSLHANALPDGENPELRRGTGTYYYHSASRRFAELVHEEVLQTANLNDDGIFDANLAVIRPADFPAILIESAYLMQPDEELLLRDEKFLNKLSNGVSRGLQRYFRELSTR